MTEGEWLACTDPTLMLEFLRGKASDRKLRLFAVECCRRHCCLLVTETFGALEVAEKFAEGLASPSERKRAREIAFHASRNPDPSTKHRRGPAKACVARALARRPYEAATGAAHLARHIGILSKTDWDDSAVEMTEWGPRIVDWSSGKQEQKVLQTTLLRDIFRNPFHPVGLHRPWLLWHDGIVRKIAQGIYEERAFDRLPILADALLDAGSDNEELMSHCRSDGPHALGCWALDLILEKE